MCVCVCACVCVCVCACVCVCVCAMVCELKVMIKHQILKPVTVLLLVLFPDSVTDAHYSLISITIRSSKVQNLTRDKTEVIVTNTVMY